MTTTTIALHTSTNCTARSLGICERIHVGDVVRVVTEQLGYMSVGEVTAISPIGGITVSFPDGVSNADFYNMAFEDTLVLHFIESELENMSV